jgi:hypothetical protein
VVAGEAEARNTPAADVAKFEGAASGNDACERGAAGVSRSEDAADAGAGNARDRYAVLLEDLKDAEVRESASKAAAQGDADTWPNGRGARTVLSGLVFPYHEGRMPTPAVRGDRSGVLNEQYVCTSRKYAFQRGKKGQGVRSYYAGTLAVPLAVPEPEGILCESGRSG